MPNLTDFLTDLHGRRGSDLIVGMPMPEQSLAPALLPEHSGRSRHTHAGKNSSPF